jgi:hypothetical protein
MVPVSGVDEAVVACLSIERLTIAWNGFKSALPRSVERNSGH